MSFSVLIPYPFIKNLLDRTMAILLLLFLSPVIICIYTLLFISDGPPIIFAQQRIGLHEKTFTLYKFRTMTCHYDSNGSLLPDSDRLTPFGSFLRSSSLDEIPQLFNILLGHMSFIGPRPLFPEYLPLYSPKQRLRHSVKPGLSGLAQIRGRNNLSWPTKFRYDVWYAFHRNFYTDLYILILTVSVVLTRRGVSAPSHATAPLFRGNHVYD